MTKQSTKKLAGWIFANLACIAGLSCTPAVPAATGNEVARPVATYVAVAPAPAAAEVEAESSVEAPPVAGDAADETADEATGGDSAETEHEVTYRRLLRRETTRAHGIKAREILDSTRDQAFGHEVEFEIDGQRFMARIERHYHEPGGQARPWGWHRGISLFAVVPAS